jgi:ABC-2 type transport system ATP-binding protein
MHFSQHQENLAAWAAAHNAIAQNSAVHCTIDRPTELAALLESATRNGLEVVDVSLQRPNLESVFLHLTGKELRS